MELSPSNINIIKRLLVGRINRPLRSILSRLKTADTASLLSLLSERESQLLIETLFSVGRATETILELPDTKATEILCDLEENWLSKIIVYSRPEDAAYLITLLKEGKGRGPELADEMIASLEKPQRETILRFINYPDSSAGRMMTSDFFVLPIHTTAGQGLDILRERSPHESLYYIYCVEPPEAENIHHRGRLVGVSSLRKIATCSANTQLKDLMIDAGIFVLPTATAEEVALLVSRHDLIAVPVVDEDKNLLGVITIDDVLDIIQEQATSDIYARAGLQEDDRVFSSTFFKVQNRIPWMMLNLALAALASLVVSFFETTMNELIILASFKNIVAGMGGNTAIQTLTVFTRGIATGDFQFISLRRSILREIVSGVSIGLITGICAGALTYLWKDNLMVSVVITLSMILNSLVASGFGATVPLVLKRWGKDPAIGSGVITTMITDTFSFFSFLGIATLGLKYFS